MALGITKGLQTWVFQESHIERNLDSSAYTSAHPDDTLVLAGPARFSVADEAAVSGVGSLLAIGMVQGFSWQQSKPTQPVMAIGQGRQFYVSGKAQGGFSMGRLFVNGRNLLRVLYHNAVAGGLDVGAFDDRPARNTTDHFYTNLDSELFYVPFGLACVVKDKLHDHIAGVYLELCMINSYSVGFNAGQSMVMESVGGVFDRVLPFFPTQISAAPNGGVPRETVDSLLGFVDSIGNNGQSLDDNMSSNAS